MNQSSLLQDALNVYSPLARRIARQFGRPTLRAEDLEQEAMICLWQLLRLPPRSEAHVEAGYKTYAELPQDTLVKLVQVAIRRRLVSVVAAAGAACRDYRVETRFAATPAEGLTVEQVAGTEPSREELTIRAEDLKFETDLINIITQEALDQLSPDDVVVAAELFYPTPQVSPDGASRRYSDRSSYSIARTLDIPRDRVRAALRRIRATFAAVAKVYGKDWEHLVRA